MNENGSPQRGFKSLSKRFAKVALDVGENRFQLLLLEFEEERQRVLGAFVLAVVIVAFSLLAGVAFTFVIVLAFWQTSPLAAVSVLAVVYAGTALFFMSRLAQLRRDWVSFSGTLSQLEKDRSCLTELLR